MTQPEERLGLYRSRRFDKARNIVELDIAYYDIKYIRHYTIRGADEKGKHVYKVVLDEWQMQDKFVT